MIGKDGWNRAHGIVYRTEPSATLLLLRRYIATANGTRVLFVDVNQEDYVTELLKRVNMLMEDTRRNHPALTTAPTRRRFWSSVNTPQIFWKQASWCR